MKLAITKNCFYIVVHIKTPHRYIGMLETCLNQVSQLKIERRLINENFNNNSNA